jgi:hypothetical protein
MADFSINQFKASVAAAGGLSRGVFYDCQITFQNEPLFDQTQLLLCKAANLPAAQLDFTDLKYFTRSVKVPAARQFQPITLSFYNTQNYDVRNVFLVWLSLYNTSISNVRNAGENYRNGQVSTDVFPYNPNGNYATIELTSRDLHHDVRGTYTFFNAFPTSIGGLNYSYENDAQVQTYDVEFQYLSTIFMVE